ncbi:hypothetical protein V8B55DRAFT_1393754 [Mucor lusitanicus]|uniref:F-box domain-containing protein n=2 Tax=Mucor circinelloides f. lusitanicus TaxID=29924 RepID=A0A168NQ25_MUCCL|nr:hypothetical protein FB192DRAFT_1390422 [Mucor lusitanicus]OAD06576.1 hypothetical protein MUCCIDRAFT_90643 [Mucor lusitanicus CBS 277.49]
MLQELPLEVLTQIAEFIPVQDAGEFARTCHKCYFAILPHIWHQLTLNNTVELNMLAKRLQSNNLWAQRAIRFVRDVSLGSDDQINQPKFSSTLAASMFGIASTPDEQAAEEAEEKKRVTRRERIGVFGKKLLNMFPHLSNLVVDFTEAARDFYSGGGGGATSLSATETEEATAQDTASTEPPKDDQEEEEVDDNARLPYSGSVSLVNYKSDHSKFMHYLLAPFRRTHHLKLEALPVVSLCDDIDESILTNADLQNLATLGLTHLRKLELSYLDSDIRLETMQHLLESMPHLNELELEWIFLPSKEDFTRLCQVIQESAHLYLTHTNKKASVYQVHFVSKEDKDE